jgi:D-alanyl-D-alanine carboxypeptidase
MGLQSLGLKTDENGFAVDQRATVSLDDLARIMIHYSGNAATDYLLTLLGQARIEKALAAALMENHSQICSLLGPTLLWLNHEIETPSFEVLENLIDQYTKPRECPKYPHLSKYINNAEWRSAQIEWITSHADSSESEFETEWAFLLLTSELLPKGTAREYAKLMALVGSGNFISPKVSSIMQSYIETLPDNWPMRTFFYRRYGEKSGMTAGVLTQASYAVPTRGHFSEQRRVVVIIANQMPYSTWQTAAILESLYLIQLDLATGKGATISLVEP